MQITSNLKTQKQFKYYKDTMLKPNLCFAIHTFALSQKNITFITNDLKL